MEREFVSTAIISLMREDLSLVRGMGLDKSDFKDKLSIEDIGKMENQLEKEFCIFSLIKKFVNLLGFSKIA